MPPEARAWTEDERLAALAAYGIVGSPCEPAYEEIAQDAAQCTGACYAAVVFVGEDEVWLKARIGPLQQSYPAKHSLCAHAVHHDRLLVVADASSDARFGSHPSVTGTEALRFYAGFPVRTPAGLPVGTVCVLDVEPRALGLSEEEETLLGVLAQKVTARLELRRLEGAQEQLGGCGEAPEAAPAQAEAPLSRRQVAVLEWAAQGKSACETGTILGVSPRTVRFHLTAACDRLGVTRTTQAVALASARGLIRTLSPAS